MIYLKTPDQIREIEYVNKLGAEVLQMCREHIKPGVATLELEEIAEKFCKDRGVSPSFKGYKGFPHSICVSINEEIIHGFPSDRIIKGGDVVSVDFGITKGGYYSDAAFTKLVGRVPNIVRTLVLTAESCLYEGISEARRGNRLFNISEAVQQTAFGAGFDVVRDYVGHGVGLNLHEDPKIPNYVTNGVNYELRVGMVLAIEPMLVEKSYEVKCLPNTWTVATLDGGFAAHFEHSIAILEDGPKILSTI
jgi:methionyl aminopeptidase